MSAPIESIVVKQGTATSRPVALTDSSGGPLDLTSAVVNFRAWEEGTQIDALGPVALEPEGPPEEGVVLLVISGAQASQLDPAKRYWYDIIVVNGPAMVQGRLYVEANRIR